MDLIEGLQPTISVDQRAGGQNPRSTVATVTEIYDYLRLLFARLGEPLCHRCGEPIRQQSPEQIVAALMELAAGTRVMILAPLVRAQGRTQGRVRRRSARRGCCGRGSTGRWSTPPTRRRWRPRRRTTSRRWSIAW